MTRALRWTVVSAALLAVGCSSRPAEDKPLVGGAGKLLVPGPAGDLRLSPDRQWAAFLKAPSHPPLKGVAPTLALGELAVARVPGGQTRELGPNVTNAPGGFVFSPDSRWLAFLAGYNPAAGAGELRVVDLQAQGTAPTALGKAVTFVSISPDSRRVAFVDGGVLKLATLGTAGARDVAGEVRVAEFTPDGKGLVFRRTYAAGGGLLLASVDGQGAPLKLTDRAGDFELSPDGRWLAFSAESPASRDIFDLYLTPLAKPAPRKVASGTDVFGFSRDSRWLARTQGVLPSHRGDLVVGPADGTGGRKVGERVERFSFAPTSDAVLAFEKHTDHPRLGSLRVTRLPSGEPQLVTAQADAYEWSPDGKFLAFNVEVYRPLPAINLYVDRVGEPKATRVEEGVYGFAFAPGRDELFYRSQCTKGEGGVMPRSCELRALDLSKPGAQPRTLVSGIYSFKPSEDGSRLLVTMVRSDSDAYDTAEYDIPSGQRRTLDERTLLPPWFASKDGKRVVYLIGSTRRPGLYVSQD